MITNRSSYLLGAALGSALMLAVCAPANAADIYDGGLKGGYDVPPPPPTDRGIYFKGYVGAADANVGDIWTEQFDGNGFSVHHKDIKSSPLFGLGIGWQARHWLRFDLTGEYRGDALFVAQDPVCRRHHRWYKRIHGRHPQLDGSRQRLHRHGQLVRLHAVHRRRHRLCHADRRRHEGCERRPTPDSVAFGTTHTNTNFAYAFYAGGSFDITPQVALELTYRYADLGSAQSGRVTTFDGAASNSGVFIKRHHVQRCDARHALQIPARSRRLSAGEVTGRRRLGASSRNFAGPLRGPGVPAPASIEAA